MKITILLCTYNRCQSLARALESAAALRLPKPDEWELLVVDNNSSDRTREVVEDFCRRYPGRFRYLFEPRQGKSYALNAGICEARGDVLAFIDDDVTADPMWLGNLTSPLREAGYAGAGGRVLPERAFQPPCWLPHDARQASAPLALFNLGLEPSDLREPPFGTNMAFRKEMFERYGGFRTDLGPCPGSEIRCEDSEFAQRLLDAGDRIRYEPSAVVYHEIRESRVQKPYFLNWWFDKARADVRAFGTPDRLKWCLGGIPLVLFRRLAVWTLRWLIAVEPSHRFSCKLNVWGVAGQIVECHRQSRESKKKAVPKFSCFSELAGGRGKSTIHSSP
jgi:glucosyl-dolichyl phosphate glucuronosyltransferase